MERGVAVEDGVRGAVAVFCLFDLRGADCGLCSVSGGEGLEPEALRFLDRLVVFGAGVGSASVSLSTLLFDLGSAASLAEERVTLDDMCE